MNDYFAKIDHPTIDLTWNIPEHPQGTLNVVGGNSQNFKVSIKISEFLANKYPIANVQTILPDALQSKLPPLPNLQFLPSTDSGSFANADSLVDSLDSADFNLAIGDFSKNSATQQALASAISKVAHPILLTRDTVDLLTSANPTTVLMHDQLIFFASMPQLQALLRAVYYPKMLLLSQSLLQVVEVLHKFTLSYPVQIITMHSGQILLAADGQVRALPLAKSGYAPFAIWSGELAAKISALNLFSPHQFFDASISAILS